MSSILIIDDNEEILSANRDYLTGQGFDVTCADTGTKRILTCSGLYKICLRSAV